MAAVIQASARASIFLTTWRHEPLPPSPPSRVDRPPPGTADFQASFVAFDLLSLEGDDLRQRPLEERREALARLVAGVDGIQFSEALATEGAIVFAHACKLGLEGIVSKRAGSRYRSGPSRNWLKCLNPEFQRR